MNIEQEVRSILSDWTNLRVENLKQFWLIAGTYGGTNHAGCPTDPVGWARETSARLRAAPQTPVVEAVIEPAPVPPAPAPVIEPAPVEAAWEPMPEPTPEPEIVPEPEAPVELEPEPEPHPFAGLIDSAKAWEDERLRLRARYLFLHHMLVDQSGGLPDLSPAERDELNDLQTRNIASGNVLEVTV